ncbi:tetratricopeptide repeat-containing sensor histidine kinase [Flavobacterium sp. MEB061]|uniref:ATP-binding protein n=1 Tax=Flavobacterium sp. MEB061 TaxID=1587524 RepID=UPI000698C3BC|nr:tetratricopeptide repeat-containing sensor histidine kinase [Flavobacterium sp. MEB061]
MMKKAFYIFANKKILKYLLITISILLLVILNSYKNKTPLKIKRKDKTSEIKKLIQKADFLFDNKPDSSYFYYNKAIQLCDPKLDYLEDYIYSLISIAEIQQNASNYNASEETLTKTLPYLKKLKNPKFTYNVYTITAYNYYNKYDNTSAINYHIKALKLAKKPFKKAEILNDIANIYIGEEKYKKAVQILEPINTLEIKHDTDSLRTINHYAMLLDNLGFCYYKLGNPKALKYLTESLKIKLKYKRDFELMTTYRYLAIFYEKSNLKLSKIYAQKSYTTACAVNNATFKANGLALLIQKTEGNELKKYSLAYIKIIDSLITNRSKAQNQFAYIKYDSKKDRKENLQLKSQKAENELQIEKQKSRNLISSVIIIFALGIIIFLYYYLTSKSKKDKNEAIYKSEMQISRKLHDELANDVYQTLTFAQNRDIELIEHKDQLLNNLQVIYSRARNISKENSTIITDENYSIALKEMISEFNDPNINFILNGLETISWNEIEKNKKITVYRVLQELLVNTKKHSDASLIGITFKKTDQSVTVSYTENGKGCDLNNVTFRNGLQNIENRILAIKGKINIDSQPNKGFKVFFKFPL